MPNLYCFDCPDCGTENALPGRTIEDDLGHADIRIVTCRGCSRPHTVATEDVVLRERPQPEIDALGAVTSGSWLRGMS